MKKNILITTLFLLIGLTTVQAQFGIGLTTGGDVYQRYANPRIDGDSSYRSSGNVLLNSSIGPKIWIGSRRFSFSIETKINFGMTALNLREYKGMGAMAFPIMAHLNFNGLSGFAGSGYTSGFAIGGGIQYNRTELYKTTNEFKYLNRKFFPTYVAEFKTGAGFGSGITLDFYTRFGLGYDEDGFNGANSLNIGISASFNITELRKKGRSRKKQPSPGDTKIQQ